MKKVESHVEHSILGLVFQIGSLNLNFVELHNLLTTRLSASMKYVERFVWLVPLILLLNHPPGMKFFDRFLTIGQLN